MTIEIILILIIAGLIAGYIDAIAGGGGMIAVPALLAVGVSPHHSLGTNKLAGTLGVFQSARIFIKQGIVKPALWLPAIIATFIGAIIGTIAVFLFSAEFLEDFIPLLILLLAIYLLIAKPLSKDHPRKDHYQPNTSSSSILGSILGFYDGFFGPGTGSFWTTLLVRYFHLDLLNALAVTKVMNFISNFASLLIFMLLGSVDYIYGFALGFAYLAGSHLGAHSAIKYGSKFIRPIFLLTVISLAIYLIVTL